MKTILCYGDSNTYGYNPVNGLRYPLNVRWTGRLQEMLGTEYRVIEEGCNGRTTVFDDPIEGWKNGLDYLKPCLNSHKPIAIVILMLGSNDLLEGRSAEETAGRMEKFLRAILETGIPILLIAPPIMKPGAWVQGEAQIQESIKLGRLYRDVANELGTDFADAAEWDVEVAFDGVHFTEKGHKAFAQGLMKHLEENDHEQ